MTRERLGQWQEKYFDGAPDLIIEVISDDSVGRDRAEKFEEYEEAGVREYWIIDLAPNAAAQIFINWAQTENINLCRLRTTAVSIAGVGKLLAECELVVAGPSAKGDAGIERN